jgi:hypothetical protein
MWLSRFSNDDLRMRFVEKGWFAELRKMLAAENAKVLDPPSPLLARRVN